MLCHPLDYPVLIAEDAGEFVGALTYIATDASWEILTLHAARQWQGVGSALVAAVERLAAQAGADRLVVITTNDNVDALRFYQRRGFRLAVLHAGAVDDSRVRLKPEIPVIGNHGIRIRDELELEKRPGG